MLKGTVIIGLLLALGGGALLVWAASQPERPADLEMFANAVRSVDANGIEAPVQDWSGLAIESNEALHSGLEEIRSHTPEQLAAEQWNRFMADLDKLVAGDSPDPETAATLYPADWATYVDDYRQHKEDREILLTAAVVVTGLGAVTLVLSILAGLVHWVVRYVSKKSQPAEIDVDHENPVRAGAIRDITDDQAPTETDTVTQRTKLDTHRDQVPARSKVSVDLPGNTAKPDLEQDVANFRRVYPGFDEDGPGIALVSQSSQNLLVDEQDASLVAQDGPILPGNKSDQQNPPTKPAPVITQVSTSTAATMKSQLASKTETPVARNEPIAIQTQQLEDRIAQVAQRAQAEDAQESDEPVNATLQALSDQISAIRQYASSQQDRVEKLQSGYDWNIIRTFCVRVIRCIDNLETRMESCEDETLVQELRDVHDELLFSLESSGVEQFAPEMNSTFSGQERLAEALKEKVPCTKPNLKGCIAQVVKPGYQYVIDDDNVKIVRTARVKLYGDTKPIACKD